MLQLQIAKSHKVKRIRPPEGKWYRGEWIYNEAEDDLIVECNVQEMSKVTMGKKISNKLLKELEGDRSTTIIKLYAPVHTFREADDTLGIASDKIEWKGRFYEIAAINHWESAQALSHDEVYAKRIDNDVNRHNA